LKSLSTYPFTLFWEEYGLEQKEVKQAWNNKGDIIIGNGAIKILVPRFLLFAITRITS